MLKFWLFVDKHNLDDIVLGVALGGTLQTISNNLWSLI